jgi:hypothetical protein
MAWIQSPTRSGLPHEHDFCANAFLRSSQGKNGIQLFPIMR